MEKPKTFLGKPPTPQHEAVAKELEAKAREEEKPLIEEAKQEEIKEEIEQVENPPKPFWWWVQTIVFWSIITYFVVVNLLTPIATRFKYGNENKDNTDEISILNQWTEEQIAKSKEERKAILCSRVVDQTKACEGVKLITPTPTIIVPVPSIKVLP